MKRSLLLALCCALPTTLVAQPATSPSEVFLNDVITCAATFNFSIDGQTRGSLRDLIDGQGATGSAQISLDSFLAQFPEEDRLKAYELYSSCLLQQYGAAQDGSSIVIGTPRSQHRLFANRQEVIDVFLDVNDPDRNSFDFPFNLDQNCQLIIEYGRDMGFGVGFRLTTARGTEIERSMIGTNIGPDREDLAPGDYIFRLVANRGAGRYRVALRTICP